MNTSTIHRWLNDGFIAGEQVTPGAPWQIRLNEELRARIVEEAPPEYLPMLEGTSAEMGVIGALNIVSAHCQPLMLKGCEQVGGAHPPSIVRGRRPAQGNGHTSAAARL